MLRYTLLIGLITFYLSNCLDSSSNIGKRIEFRFFADNVGQEITHGSDTVRVWEIKFTSTAFKITNEDSVELGNTEELDIILYVYNQLGTTDVIVLSAGLGFELNEFTEFELNVSPTNTVDPFFDNDFYGSDVIYSLVIEGTVNGSEFLFRTIPNFTKQFTTDDPVTITDENETLFLRTTIDVQDLFKDENGDFLDPGESENVEEITNNFESLLSGELFAGSVVN